MKEPRARELTEQQEKFLEALFGEAQGDYTLALKLAGYSPNIRKRDVIRSLGDIIREMTLQEFLLKGPKAAAKIDHVLDNPTTPNAKNILDAAKEILNRSNVGVAGEGNQTKGASVFIMPPKGSKITVDDTSVEVE